MDTEGESGQLGFALASWGLIGSNNSALIHLSSDANPLRFYSPQGF